MAKMSVMFNFIKTIEMHRKNEIKFSSIILAKVKTCIVGKVWIKRHFHELLVRMQIDRFLENNWLINTKIKRKNIPLTLKIKACLQKAIYSKFAYNIIIDF